MKDISKEMAAMAKALSSIFLEARISLFG